MGSYFDKRALLKCHDRLNKSREALFRCRNAKSIDDFYSQWASFVGFSGSVIHAVEAGSNDTPQARQWYGGVRRFCKADPLLLYMYQARNAEEHGTESVIAHNPMPVVGRINPDTDSLEPMNLVDGRTMVKNADGSVTAQLIPGFSQSRADWNIGIGSVPTGPVLLPVYDKRFGNRFAPPTSHDGKELRDTSPLAIGELFLTFLEGLVDQASHI